MEETRWRLTPLDDSELMYFGLDVTNGNQAAIFIRRHDQMFGHVSDEDRAMMEAIIHLSGDKYYDALTEADINEIAYRIVPWDRDFDRGLVRLIDRLTQMRMTNAQSVSLRLQLEMPL